MTRAILLVLVIASGPASAIAQEIDFSGQWAPIYHEDGPERLPGPELGDYLGLPINDAARLRADSYDADRISAVSEYQCRQHAADYGMRGLANMRITAEIDPLKQRLLAFHTRIGFHDAERTIYLDGRPHPADIADYVQFMGHSTGKWEGDTLVVDTVGINDRTWLDSYGLEHSDKLHLTERFQKTGPDAIKYTVTYDDPVFFTKPWSATLNFARQGKDDRLMEYVCNDNEKDRVNLVPTPRQE